MKKILVSCPIGHTFVRGLLIGLYRVNLLHTFHTSVACFESDFMDRLGNFSMFRDFKRRKFISDIQCNTHTYPFMELGRMASQKLGIKTFLTHETGKFSVDKCCQYIDRKVADYIVKHNDISGVYAYEDCALETFQHAKKSGIKCIYDLPIAYWEYGTQLMQEESERLPDWIITLGGGIKDSDEKHIRKVKELELADIVVVPSSFVKYSLPEWAKDKPLIESPFGTPALDNNSELPVKKANRPLRVLFVGSMGQRKGLGDLFEAMKLLNNSHIELVVLGSLLASMEFYRKQFSDFRHETTRPHYQVLELMRTCDVFCLPSIVEGRALVMQEAMSQGLPIIITPNTGGEDLVIDGETGFLIPIRSPEKIAEKINWFVENREKIPNMGEKARQHAATYTWKRYSDTIIDAIT
jgi:glycosyltransferase involved in cell wall biosynthesis